MKIKSDSLHSLFVGVVSFMLLRKRDVLYGRCDGRKYICLSFDCDYQEDIAACKPIIEFLKSEEVPASFAIIGNLAAAFPDTIEGLIRNDFEILNHTMSHPPKFRRMASNVIRSEVEGFQEFIMKTYNYTPKGFRSPHGLRKARTDLFKILKERGMYDSSLLGYGIADIDGTCEIPLTPCPEHPLIAFDTYHHFRFPVFISSVKKVLSLWELLLQKNTFINIFLDPVDLTTKTRLQLLDEMIKKARNFGFTFIQMGRLYEELNNL